MQTFKKGDKAIVKHDTVLFNKGDEVKILSEEIDGYIQVKKETIKTTLSTYLLKHKEEYKPGDVVRVKSDSYPLKKEKTYTLKNNFLGGIWSFYEMEGFFLHKNFFEKADPAPAQVKFKSGDIVRVIEDFHPFRKGLLCTLKGLSWGGLWTIEQCGRVVLPESVIKHAAAEQTPRIQEPQITQGFFTVQSGNIQEMFILHPTEYQEEVETFKVLGLNSDPETTKGTIWTPNTVYMLESGEWKLINIENSI